MKKTLLLLSLAIVISCSPESKNEEENINPVIGNKLVKREYVSDNFNLEYRYSEKDLLSKIFDIQLEEEIHDVVTFKYDSNDNVVERYFESKISSYESTTIYHYDNSNRITEAIITTSGIWTSGDYTRTTTQLFSYSDNVITANIISHGGSENVIILETNNSGLITKMKGNYGSSTFDYDSNGNIESIITFDNQDDLLHSHNYNYDSKPNPFYGQFASIYLPMFLDAFDDAYFGEIVYGGYLGYSFPFLKNNITATIENGDLDEKYNYSYDSADYPINVIEEYNGENYLEFDIEYYE